MARPTFPPISDTVAVDLLYTSNDGVAIVDCQNRLWAHYDAGVSVAQIEALCEAIRASWATNIAPLVQTEYILIGMRAKNWNDVNNAVIEVDFTPVPGTATGDPIPFTSCAIVRWQTEGTTPSSCYIRHGGIVESQVDGQHLGTAAVTSIQSAWLAVSGDITDVAPSRDHVCVQVFQPNPTPPNIYKDAGTVEDVSSVVVRRRLGRSVSRQR